jgi:phosphomannomutase
VGWLVDTLSQRDLPATVGVARDGRHSGRRLARQAVEGIRDRGVDVVDFGVVCTPTAKVAARSCGLGGLVVVTGSHLGAEWNGLKLVAGPDFQPLDAATMIDASLSPVRAVRGCLRLDRTAARRHAAAACRAVDGASLRAAGLAVALRGGAGPAAPLALRRLGCRLNGSRVDAGLVLDGDGDRLVLVDEQGSTLDSEATLCLAAIAADASSVVKGADTSRMIDLVMAERGGSVHVTQPGELHLLAALATTGAELAGEGNGGVVVPAVGMARDGLAAAVLILGLMARTGRPLSKLAGELPRLTLRRFTVPCSDEERAHLLLAALAGAGGQRVQATRAGLRLQGTDGTWALARRSATEPVLRVTVEASRADRAASLEAELRARIAATA